MKLFFDTIRPLFSPLTSNHVIAIEFLIENTKQFTRQQQAYILATVYHETAHTMRPIKEYGGDAYFNRRYGPKTRVGKILGNIKDGDGALYCGRGYVQITGRSNYSKFSKILGARLLAIPDKALDTSAAVRIMCHGMEFGTFTGKSITDYINDAKTDYIGARRVINGTDKARKIAGYAELFEKALATQVDATPKQSFSSAFMALIKYLTGKAQ